MVARSRPAVFACPMRNRNGAEPKKISSSPHYSAWPEIAKPSNFYTLATLCSFPAIQVAMYSPMKTYLDVEFYMPEPEEILLEKDYQGWHTEPYYGIGKCCSSFNYCSPSDSNSFAQHLFLEGNDDPEWTTLGLIHDVGHLQSFRTERLTIMKLNSLASCIFNLLKPAGVAQCTNFWEEFQVRNEALLGYLDKTLILEELRANVFAFLNLDSRIWSYIETDLRERMRMTGILSFFDDLTAQDVHDPFWLTIFAEVFDPEDPIRGVRALTRLTNWREEFSYKIRSKHLKSGWRLFLMAMAIN
jgi:hypothetical protein